MKILNKKMSLRLLKQKAAWDAKKESVFKAIADYEATHDLNETLERMHKRFQDAFIPYAKYYGLNYKFMQ